MLIKLLIPVWCSLLLVVLGGCSQLDAWTDTTSKHDDPAAGGTASALADKLYVNPDAPAGAAGYRNIYIAPANLANMQVIQPEGASSDSEWWVTEEEDTVLQRAIAYEYTIALTYQSDFNIVTDRAQAQMVVNTALVAVHPDETRASAAKDGNPGGSLTVSVVVVDAASGAVLLRAVDTRSSEDIWAFNQVKSDDPAPNRMFATWGADIRRGILQLQGRSG